MALNLSPDVYLELIRNTTHLPELHELKQRWFGKSGEITQALKALSTLDLVAKQQQGEQLHQLKKTVLETLSQQEAVLRERAITEKLLLERVNVDLPVAPSPCGFEHPIMKVFYDVSSIFREMGFSFHEGPEIESEFYNFDALNVIEGHPARDEQDTFYLPNGLLRTQTSSVQIRLMEGNVPPLKMISPGRVYRSDYDQTHTPMFHQIEGLVVSKTANMAELKGVLHTFLEKFFHQSIALRFRPSFFPFTEPSCEVDIGYRVEGKRIVLEGSENWLEILGCGMVHPNVLHNCGISPDMYQGYAFGMGLERLTMLKYGIHDLRELYRNDQRWLESLNLEIF